MAITILINGVGGPTPRSIARSLHRYGKQEVRLIGTDINPLAYGLYETDLYHKTYVIPPAGDPDYWSALEKIVEEHDIDLALVQPELEVLEWSRHKSAGKEWPCKTLLPDHEIVKYLVDKSLMTAWLKETDLVPNSLDISPNELDFKTIEKKLGYPFWIRSTSGSSGLGSLKVEDQNSLKNWITINPEVDQFIGSTFLPGRNLACKLLFHEGKLLRAASGERVNYIMSKVAPSGITGNTSFGRLLNEPKLVERSERALRIIEEKSGKILHGFFTADFKEDNEGKAYLTEINVRMVAFNMLFAAGGANFSEDIVNLLTNISNFDMNYKMYEFEDDLIFLRDVDAEPILMKETDLLKKG
ncbi:carbamoyl-phosphate synthase large subunit [Mesonia algae]|uniref:Carbamoyl-phosphate synthase large subunit n=1 Tax=Mesonia algae TaxID=213248 RepID=A0A2W7IAP7_9FLAO|nr:hypothetical protein [Mesonia algae]PZW43764.1 carbamoyl-phosphate synthase large subunit [Mesonia algae]